MVTPSRLSRYRFCSAYQETDGTVMLTEPQPFGFIDLPDNRHHMVREGETLWGLASVYFKGIGRIERPNDLWWVIADFQPQPIYDPTEKLAAGRLLHIPSKRTVIERVFANSRLEEHL